MTKERVYLDYAATAPLLARAGEAMAAGFDLWANPSSPHLHGRNARAALEDARARIAAALDWRHDIVLTGGASEAIAIALGQGKPAVLISSPVEHDAVLRRATDAVKLAVDLEGRVVLASLARALDAARSQALVAVQSVNSETGVVQDLAGIAALVQDKGAVLFADCAQSAGKMPLPDADLIAVSAHKLGGPIGVGALLVKDLAILDVSGGQEKGYRPGTENLPAAMGFAAALEAPRAWLDRATELRQQMDRMIVSAGGEVVAAHAARLPTIGSYRMAGVAANAQLIQFDLAGVSVSAGSACSSGTLKSSHVLTAMGWDDAAAGEVIRVSIGPETSRAHIYRFVEVWREIQARAKG